jgi:hypothetical protein
MRIHFQNNFYMTEKQVLLIKYSWSYVADKEDELANMFRKKIGQITPSLKPAFRSSDAGALPIIRLIHHLVSDLPDAIKAETRLGALWKEYELAGISRSHDENALIALLLVLEKKLGKRWSMEIKEAWIFVFTSLRLNLSQPRKKAA